MKKCLPVFSKCFIRTTKKESSFMKLAIDAMGGDYAPEEIVRGAMDAVSKINDLQITLMGNEADITPFLTDKKNIDIIHTDEMIAADEDAVGAVRRNTNAALVLMAKAVKEQRADACISAGHTGALMSAGLFGIGRIPGIARPALSPTIPPIAGQRLLLLDVGS